MPSNIPARVADVYFVGAGLSSAFGIPNTQQLLNAVHDLASTNGTWAASKGLNHSLADAYKFFFPIEGGGAHYRPNVVDFFSVLKTYSQVSAGMPGRLPGVEELQVDLKRALVNVLIDALRRCDALLAKNQPELDAMLQPGNYIITSNWDLLIERYCWIHSIPLRHTASGSGSEVTLLKLHGSIDWCRADTAKKSVDRVDYRSLRERVVGSSYSVDPADDGVLRITGLEQWSRSWQQIKSRAEEPLMITMALGKGDDLQPLSEMWRTAYGAISRAKRLELIGYSVPTDDIEIRTLLVAGIERGRPRFKGPKLIVRNPSPEVHNRFRSTVSTQFEQDFRPVAALG